MVTIEALPNIVVRCGPPASENVVVSAAHVNQSAERLIQAALVTDDELEAGVGVQVDLSERCVQNLFDRS